MSVAGSDVRLEYECVCAGLVWLLLYLRPPLTPSGHIYMNVHVNKQGNGS